MNGLKNSVLIVAAAALLLVSISAVAQEDNPFPPGREGAPGMMGHGPHQRGLMGRLGEELGLTAEQKAQIRAIMAEEMPAARERIEERVAGLLTAEQQSKLEQLKDGHPAMGCRGRGPGALLERMTQALELTEDQQTAIRGILADAAPEMRSGLREKINSVLTPEQQEKAEALREQHRARRAERRGF